MNLRSIRSLFLTAVLLSFLSACASNPVTGSWDLAMPRSWDANAGAEYHQEILKQYQVYNDPELQAYVDDIGQRLAAKSDWPELEYTFTLLDSPEVNAFALPGGFIYVTRGIMSYMNKESHLAGVIGHEIGHVTARHGAQRAMQQQVAGVASIGVALVTGSAELAQASQVLGGALMSGYGRSQELQSDRLGAEYIAKNNYDVDEMLGVIGILKNQELYAAQKAKDEGREQQAYHSLFSTHPENDTRLKEVVKAAEKFRDITEPVPDDGRFLRMTDGMVFGESPSQGITRANKFYHRDLDLFVEFPSDWRIVNQPTQLFAISPGNDQAISMVMDSTQKASSPDRYLNSEFQSFRNGQNVITSFGNAHAGIATVSDESSGQQQNVRVSALYRGDQALILTGLGNTPPSSSMFLDVVKNIRGLNSNERTLASGSNIELVTAQRGDTFAKLAQQSGLDDAEAQIRLINDMYPSGEPTPGQLIKVIK